MRHVVVGIAAGYGAGKVMDQVTTAYLERQSDASKRRENELQEETSYVKAAEKLADWRGKHIDQERAQQAGQWFHVGLGVSGGVAAAILAGRGMNTLAAGLLTGVGMWILVDEAGNAILGLTPPATAYPVETHIRGLVGHLAYGAALGVFVAVGRLLIRRRRKD